MENVKRVIAALVLCLVLPLTVTVCAEGAARTPEDARMLEEVRQSVVHLYAVGYNDQNLLTARWTGTGFAVGTAGEDSDVFLTNWHVVTGSGKYPPDKVRIWLLQDDAVFDGKIPAPETSVECRVLAASTGYPDVAVVQTVEPVAGYKALPLLSSRRVADQTPVYALGFPGLQATRYGVDSGPEDVAITAGVVTKHLIMTSAGYSRAIIHNAATRHGNSGGPLVNSQGAVVAQNTYGFTEDVSTDLFCAVYIDYGMDMLDSLGISYTAVPGPSRITVLVANLLHMPNIGDVPAAILFAAAIVLVLLFLWQFLKALREAVQEIRQKRK